MSFLTINGWAIPLADVSQKRRIVGAREQAFSGAILRSERAVKYDLTCRTNQLSEMTAAAIRGLVSGEGDTWHLNNDLYSGKGLDETGTAVKTFRGAEAADGNDVDNETPFDSGYVCAFEAGTTNMFVENVRTGTDALSNTTGFSAVAGAVLSSDTSYYWQGSRSLEIAISANGDGAETGTVACDASTLYHASFYVYCQYFGGTLTAQLYDDSIGALGSATVEALTPNGKWTRIKVSGTTDAGATNIKLRVTFDISGILEVLYLDGLQLEDDANSKGTYSSWYNGTRSAAEAAAYAMPFSAEEYTVAFWARQEGELTGSAGYLFDIESSGAALVYAAITSSGLSAVTGSGSLSEADVFDDDNWHHVAMVTRRDPETGEDEGELYVDGVSVDTTSNATAAVTTAMTLYIGGNDSTDSARASLADFILLPFAAPPALIALMAARSSNWPAPPSVEISGDVIIEATRTCEGVIEGEKFVSYSDEGTRRINGRVLEFVLEEA